MKRRMLALPILCHLIALLASLAQGSPGDTLFVADFRSQDWR
jgi:hypothetical protein